MHHQTLKEGQGLLCCDFLLSKYSQTLPNQTPHYYQQFCPWRKKALTISLNSNHLLWTPHQYEHSMPSSVCLLKVFVSIPSELCRE